MFTHGLVILSKGTIQSFDVIDCVRCLSLSLNSGVSDQRGEAEMSVEDRAYLVGAGILGVLGAIAITKSNVNIPQALFW